jgi:peptide-methionine (S)-S-oxide reductase
MNILTLSVVSMLTLSACDAPSAPPSNSNQPKQTMSEILSQASTNSIETNDSIAQATFGAGCFWCVEAVYLSVNGVSKVESGYTGGANAHPTYKEVCGGNTGHAEVCQITYDPRVVSYAQLLEVFFEVHDPTTLNRQGADVGTQYRSVIYYHNDEQKKLAELAILAGNQSGVWEDPIVTEISSLGPFYVAEDYHQNYYNENGEQPYCRMVVRPKVDKFKKKFEHLLKAH